MKRLAFLCLMLAVSSLGPQFVAQQAAGEVFIAFVATRSGNEDIFITTLDNRLTYNLTNARSRDWHPTWSPDGTRLAFISDRDGNQEIYTMQANGSDQRNLSRNPALDTSPDWSPVSDDIVFVSDRDGGYDLYILSAADGTVRRLTSDGTPKSDPDWSPDGTQVIYWELNGTDTAALKSVSVESGTVETVIPEGQNLWPAWSPDGRSIAYHTPKDGGTVVIRRITLADGISVDLTDSTVDNSRPDWSPDSSQIAFMSNRDGNYNIYLMNADGSGQRRLTDVAEDDISPAWQPRPAIIDFSNTAVGLSAAIITGAIDGALQTELGQATASISAPERASLGELIPVRLHVTLEGVELGNADNGTLQSQEAIVAQQFMGARLTGSALSKFEVIPSYLEYVQLIKPNEVNTWEWQLIPKGIESTGRTFLAIELYLPDLTTGSVDSIQIVKTMIAQFEVVTTPVEIEETIQTEALSGFRVLYTSDQYLAIVFDSEMDVTGLSIRLRRSAPINIAEQFESLAIWDNVAQAGMCLYFVVEDAQPVLPRECQSSQTLSALFNSGNVFWVDRGVLIDVVFEDRLRQADDGKNKIIICQASKAPTWCELE